MNTALAVELNVVEGKVVTTSRDVAEKFGKRHADVIRSIQTIDCSEDFTQRNFAFSEYKDSTGRSLPMFTLTRDAFTILAMGFTGKSAMQWKEKYIAAFNMMEKELLDQSKSKVEFDHTAIKALFKGLVKEAVREEFDDRFGSSKVVKFPTAARSIPTKNYDSEPWDCTYNFLKTKTNKVHPTKLGAQSRKLCEKYGVIKREGCHPQNIYVKTGYYPVSILEETYRGIVNV